MRNVTHTALRFFIHKADVNLHQLSVKHQKTITATQKQRLSFSSLDQRASC